MHLQSGFQYDSAVLNVAILVKKKKNEDTHEGGGAGRVKKTPSRFPEIIVPSDQNTTAATTEVLRM